VKAFDAIVIGAGQAGLAAGYYLQQAGVQFTLLDGGASVGEAWRNRWDSLRLFTPARYNALPGLEFPGPRYAFPSKDEVADYLALYAHMFRLPIEHGVHVAALQRDGDRFTVAARDGNSFQAASVIVATGANQRPYIPGFASSIDARVVQAHSSAYRRPAQVPDGKVLVVGAGNSGAQIALELAAAGRKVVLSGPDTGSMPRRWLGRDLFDWTWPTVMRPPVDSVIGRRLMRGRLFAGDPLIGMDSRSLARAGLERAGRVVAARNGAPVLEDGRALADLAAIVWCTGFRPDYDWIDLPVVGLDGYPEHRRGIARVPGLAFLGMRLQYRLGSALLGGVGEDARHVVGELAKSARLAGGEGGIRTVESPPWTSSCSKSSMA
jgi:putative flavoprotein involved in K+ transport